MGQEITDDVYGCLIGGAIGDALGASVEGWTHTQIQEEYETFENFEQYYMPYSNSGPGAITSDTTWRQYLCLAIVEKGGRITPDDFAAVLFNHLNPDRVWINGEIVLKKLSAGMDPWNVGIGTIPDSKVTSAITPIGIINAGNPPQAYQDGFNVASVLQDDYHRHASATVAAGVAEAIMPDATIESVLQTMFDHSMGVVERAIDIAMAFAEQSDSIEEIIEMIYDRFLDWRWPAVQWDREKYFDGELFSASSLESMPVAMAILYACDGEVNRSIVEGVNYGRDSDAVGTITGSIAGALHGADTIRSEWKKQCEAMNQDFFEELEGDPNANFHSMTERLVEVLENEQNRSDNRAETLDRILRERDS